MTETNSTPTTQIAAQTAAPVVNIEETVKKAVADATQATLGLAEKKANEIAAKRLQEVGRALSGDNQTQNATEVALQTFVADPLKTLHSLKEITKREIREEQDKILSYQNEQRQALDPVVNDYPELKSPNKMALVEKLADKYLASGLSYKDALKKGAEETVKEFGLKSVSEAERDGYVAGVSLPHGGGARVGTPKISQEQSTANFMSGMKSRLSSFRKRAS